MKPLVVVYDQGAASPGEIAAGLVDVAPLVFVVAASEHARSRAPVMAHFGTTVDSESAADTLVDHQPAGIVTFSERTLRLTTELANRLGLPFHSAETTLALTDKWVQRQALACGGVPAVRSHRITEPGGWTEARERVGLPAVLKPAHGGGSINTHLIEDADTGERLVSELLSAGRPGFEAGGAMVLEEYLRGRETHPFGDYVSVESAVVDGAVEHIAITGKLPLLAPFREQGNFWPPALGGEEQREIAELAARAITAVGVHSGLTHTEIKLTVDGPRIIEVNGRLGGDINELCTFVLDTSLTELAGRIALGQPVGVPRAPRDRVYFHVRHIWPRAACELVAVEHADRQLALPGVSAYRPLARPGMSTAGGTHTDEIDGTLGVVADHQEFAAMLDDLYGTIHFHVRLHGEDTIRVLNGHQLRQL